MDIQTSSGNAEPKRNPKDMSPEKFTSDEEAAEQSAGGDRGLDEGSNNAGMSGGAGGAQWGPGANVPAGKSLEDQGRRNGIKHGSDKDGEQLVGQGGYGSSGFQDGSSGSKQSVTNTTKGTSDNDLRGVGTSEGDKRYRPSKP